MTAQGYLNQKQRHPIALAAAIAINLGGVTAVMLAKSGAVTLPPEIIQLIPIAPEPLPPEPIEPEPPKAQPQEKPIFIPRAKVSSGTTEPGRTITGTTDPMPTGGEAEPGPKAEPEPTPLPVLTEPVPLASAARDFQPPYPPQLLRMSIEGKAVVRVLIGTDGRVKQVAIIAADDPLFGDATERQALRKWRFRPATRDGTAVESWKQMTVRFQIR